MIRDILEKALAGSFSGLFDASSGVSWYFNFVAVLETVKMLLKAVGGPAFLRLKPPTSFHVLPCKLSNK